MDDVTFDNLARTFATTRRGLFKHLTAGLLGGAGGLLGLGATAAQSCEPLRRRCAADGECCSGFCDPATGRCACGTDTEQCGQDCLSVASYQNDPDNCGACRVRCRRAPECQTAACIDGVCTGAPDPAQLGQSCNRGQGVCQADGACACPPDRPASCRRGCADTASDPDNCGACDNRCRSTAHGAAVCTGGLCGIACDAGYAPCGDSCCQADRACCNGVCCPPGQCCNEAGDCSSDACDPHCFIDGEDYPADTINPSHDCQVCDPGRSTTSWSLVDDDTACGGVPGRVCCNGDCCSPTECCNPTGFCEECGPHCRIGGDDVDAGAANPADPCQVCNPDANPTGWSTAADDTVCGGDLDDEQVCCSGQCCSAGQCCNDGVCGACRCQIGNDSYAADQPNPGNACQVCNPDRDRDDWSPAPPNSPCGLSNGRSCCEGVCCPQGECCNAIGECEACGCLTGTQEVVAGAVNPANTCQVCNPDENREDWTVLDNGDACGTDADDRVCCGGACCPQGECCTGGSCQPCGCEIGGDTYAPQTPNPDNPCQICDPSRARLAWSPVLSDVACGPSGDQTCCGGECCAADQCCILDACGTCLCAIGNDTFPPDAPNPANPCEVCNPDTEPFAWTPRADRDACGDEQVCCSGSCCEPDDCCTLGVCGPCGCQIGEETYEEGAVNPDNPCQYCDPVLDQTNWSPNDDAFCGESGIQVCCAGACCPPGNCCNLEGACEPCRCEIEGQLVDAETINSDNPCLACKPADSTTAWTPLTDSLCGDDQICCAGVCCESLHCCSPEGACLPCQCVIDGVTYQGGDIDPDNSCQSCSPLDATDDWTTFLDNVPCADGSGNVCCNGACCPDGECCHAQFGLCGPAPCQCIIGDLTVNEGERNPDNACESCQPSSSPDAWTPVDDNLSCDTVFDPKARFCCAGVCCPIDQCCRSDDTCGPCVCTIDGVEFEHGQRNPANDCEFCDSDADKDGWTVGNDHLVCGENLDRFCCAGSCCPDGECCHSLDGICGEEPCGCAVPAGGGTVTYPEGTTNPSNRCEHCDPAENPAGWSPRPDRELCGGAPGPMTGQCCQGVCCATDGDQCCLSDGTCGRCVCTIDGQEYLPAVSKPDSACEICDPFQNHTGWTALENGAACGETFEQVCCGGGCCQTGTCCDAGSNLCQPCGCEIAGATYSTGTRNPANDCEVCDPSRNATAWSIAADHAKCGDDLNQVCCNGSCCPDGECCRAGFTFCSIEWCGLTDPCNYEDPCGCTIDGVFYPHQTINPANGCQVCDAYFSTTSWYHRGDFAPCGPNGDQSCCDSVCCELGACCNTAGVCEFGSPNCRGCIIGGRFYRHLSRNPDNPCQNCNADLSTTSWSNTTNDTICGEMVDDDTFWGYLVCCEGVCCTEWYSCCRADLTCGQGPCPSW